MDLRCTLKLCDTVVFDEMKPLSLNVVNFCPIPTNELHEIIREQKTNIFKVMMSLCYCLSYGLYGLSM